MQDLEIQINALQNELNNILKDYKNELDEVTKLIKDKEYIAAFNYADKFITKNKLAITEKYKDITTDIYLTLM